MLEHGLDCTLAAAEPGKQGEGGEDVDEAEGIIDQQSAAIALGNFSAVSSYQIGKDGEESDGSVVGDDLDELHHHIGKAGQPLAHDGVLTAGHLHGEAEEDGEHDQRQHGTTAQQAHEIGRSEEVDDHFREGSVLTDLFSHHVGPGSQHRGKQLHQQEHDDGGNGTGDDEGADCDAHDLTGSLTALHVGHGTGNRGEHQRHHDAEHHVDEHGAQESNAVPKVGGKPAHQGTGDHATQQDRQKTVILCDRFFVHKSSS